VRFLLLHEGNRQQQLDVTPPVAVASQTPKYLFSLWTTPTLYALRISIRPVMSTSLKVVSIS
jgi:hypothetical protein